MSSTRSVLENALDKRLPVISSAEWRIELLRQVLSGEIGTPAQRASLIRITDQVNPETNVLQRLHVALNIPTPPSIAKTDYPINDLSTT